MKITSEVIKAAVAAYYRYQRQCHMVAFEVDTKLKSWNEEMADVIAVFPDHYVIVEVKTTIGDLRRDRHKRFHQRIIKGLQPLPRHFYFAVPRDIANAAKEICHDLYPYAGVMGCHSVHDYDVVVYKTPRVIQGERLTKEDTEKLMRSQTATLCRLARKVAELTDEKRGLWLALKEYQDLEKLREKVAASEV